MNKDFIKLSLSGLMALTLSVQAFGQQYFSLKGSVVGMPDSIKIVLSDIEDPNGEHKTLAEGMSKDGAFDLSGEIKSPTMCTLSFMRYLPARGEYITNFSTRVMAQPADMTFKSELPYDSLRKVRGNERVINISGSAAHDEFSRYIAEVMPAELNEREKSYLSAEKYFASNANEDTVAKYDVIKKIAAEDLLKAQREFIAKYPSYNYSAYLIQKELEKQFVYTADEIDVMADLVKVCPDTARTATVDRRRTFAHKYALKRQCPEFDVTNVDGSVSPFASLITPGKYTFIDFWASWCGPCRSAIPHVRELYNKYGDKLAVFSISVDEKEGPWRKAMEQEKMEWTQLHLDAGDQMTKAAQAFFLTSIPRLILLNDKGEVICSSNLPRELSDCLEKELGK